MGDRRRLAAVYAAFAGFAAAIGAFSGQPVQRSYKHSDVAGSTDEQLKTIDQGFINDTYWLLFPMHLVWDQGMEISKDGLRPLPILLPQGHNVRPVA